MSYSGNVWQYLILFPVKNQFHYFCSIPFQPLLVHIQISAEITDNQNIIWYQIEKKNNIV